MAVRANGGAVSLAGSVAVARTGDNDRAARRRGTLTRQLSPPGRATRAGAGRSG